MIQCEDLTHINTAHYFKILTIIIYQYQLIPFNVFAFLRLLN